MKSSNNKDLIPALNSFITETLFNRPRSSYTAISDPDHKKVLIRYSSCFLEGYRRIINDLHNEILHPAFKWRKKHTLVTVLACNSINDLDIVEKQVQMRYWIQHYEQLGYEVLNERPPVRYKIKYSPVINKYLSNNYVEVSVKAVKGRKTVVGKFSNMLLAERWVLDTYSNPDDVTKLIYHESVLEKSI